MEVSEKIEDAVCTLSLSGNFDFCTHRAFKNGYETPLSREDVREIRIDFAEVTHIDASALGMLLILKERASSVGKRISLSGVKGQVKTTLEIANFGRLFPIKD